jgi:Ala-tRNA(Pro) deacylase
MITSERQCLDFLSQHAISYQRSEHPPVYTCEEANQYHTAAPGVSTKNLFLRDEKQHFFLVMTGCEKRLDLKELGRRLGGAKLHFASEEQLLSCLGVTPGAVTVLALANDLQQQVELLVDAETWPGEAFLCHPLVNTSTLVLARADLLRFFEISAHTPRIVEMPGK